MSAPIIWIGIPLGIAVLSWFFRRFSMMVLLIVSGLAFILALTSWIMPIDTVIWVGPWPIELQSTFSIMGRKFVINDSDRPFLVLIYSIGAFWFLGGTVAKVSRNFASLGLGVMALLVAALSVEPFLYAALLIEIAVLLSVPMLLPPDGKAGQGLLRYLILQSLAMPFMLFAGWVAGGVEANPADEVLLTQNVVFIGIGFALWLAVIPFHSWVPLLTGETHPYVAGFILSILPVVVLLLALDFLDAFIWLREFEWLIPVLRITGALMVVFGGITAAFQQNLSRLFGYAVIMENGFSLLALSLVNQVGLELLVVSFFPRILGLAVWALALSLIKNDGFSVTFKGIHGLLPERPITCGALILAVFSLCGVPLLVGFPVRQAIYKVITAESIIIGAWVFAGNLGFLFSGFRMLAAFAGSEQKTWKIIESWPQIFFLAGGTLALLITGILPGWYLEYLVSILRGFTYLR